MSPERHATTLQLALRLVEILKEEDPLVAGTALSIATHLLPLAQEVPPEQRRTYEMPVLIHTPLRSLRKRLGVTLEDMGRAVEMDTGNLSKLERGLQGASPELASRIAQFFNGQISEMEILFPERYVASGASA